MSDLWSALCLVAVLEGLFLFVSPEGWKRAAARLYQLREAQLRMFGGVLLLAGTASLWWLRH